MSHAKETSQYWPEGKELPGGYRVVGHLGQGGMGTVYLVERRVSLRVQQYAVKTMIPRVSKSAEKRRNFLRELRTWIDLPDHPHLAGCMFFRTIEDTLAIFAEYVEGSSLDKWILANKNASISTILDLAIQMAWGIHCAHECDVIHQDIKPSNVLVSNAGVAKITDFGLARHRFTGQEVPQQTDSGHTYLVSSQGMTMPYCSLEQAMGRKLSRKTDMWSYGLTVLQMFNGALTWRLGSAAGEFLEIYLKKGPEESMPVMPEGVIEILRKCFQEDPADRWSDMSVIATKLSEEYKTATGIEYPRKRPEITKAEEKVDASSERNTLDGGQWVDPELMLKWALEQVEYEGEYPWDDLPETSQATERGRALRDIEVYEIVEQVYDDHIRENKTDREAIAGLANVMFNRALAVEVCKDMGHAAEIYVKVRQLLEGDKELGARELAARAALNGSICWYITGNIEQTIKDIEFAVEQYRELVKKRPIVRFLKNTSTSLMNKSIILDHNGRQDEALESMHEATGVTEELLKVEASDNSWNQMGFVQLNLGLALHRRGQYDEAMDALVQAWDIYEMLLDSANRYDYAACYSNACVYRAMVLRRLHKLDEASKYLDLAREFTLKQVNVEKREDFRGDLAKILMQLSEISLLQNAHSEALEMVAEAETIIEQVAVQEDDKRHMYNLRVIAFKHAAIMYAVGDKTKAMEHGADTLVMWMQEARQKGWDSEKTLNEMELAVDELVSDLEYFNRPEIALGIKRLVHTMGKKIQVESPEVRNV